MSRTWAINSKLGFHSCIKAEHHKIRADYFEQRRWISFSVSSAVNLRRVNLQLLGGLGVVKKTKPGSLRPWAEAAPHARSAKLLLLLWDQWRPVRSSFWWMWNYFYLLLSVRGGGGARAAEDTLWRYTNRKAVTGFLCTITQPEILQT